MSISESDWMLLDSYLDDELTEEQIEQLRVRLAAEHDLADALAQLRRERTLRQKMFSSLDPDEAAVQNLVTGIRGEIEKHNAWSKRWKISRTFSGAAACLLVGIFSGWMVHDYSGPQASDSGKPPAVATVAPQGNTVLVSNTNGNPTPPKNESTGEESKPGELYFPQNQKPYQVVLVDDTGKPIAVQKFKTAEDAKKFAEEMNQWQNRPKPPTNSGGPGGNVKLVDQLEF